MADTSHTQASPHTRNETMLTQKQKYQIASALCCMSLAQVKERLKAYSVDCDYDLACRFAEVVNTKMKKRDGHVPKSVLKLINGN